MNEFVQVILDIKICLFDLKHLRDTKKNRRKPQGHLFKSTEYIVYNRRRKKKDSAACLQSEMPKLSPESRVLWEKYSINTNVLLR